MSNLENVITDDLDPEFFQSYANKIAEESKKKASGTFTPKDYEDIAYLGLETGINKIMRLIGAPPGSESMGYTRKDYDPKQIMMCEIKDDEGKKFVIKLPLREDLVAHNHILHRLYDKVAETTWINKKKIFVNENKYPELWAALTKGGYKAEDGYAYSIAAGYKSTTFTVMNTIDRSDSWCADNKHTKILARDINIDSKGNAWPKPGVKSFGFLKRVADIIGKYGNYETYDIAIKRTGDKENPFELKNASIYKQKDLLDELKNANGTLPDGNIIVIGPLTATEKTYGRYNLDKLFQPTSYTKLMKRVPSIFKLTDACLGTKFYEELEQLSVKEKAEWAKLYGETEEAQAVKETAAIKEAVNIEEDTQTTEAPKRRTSVGPVHTGLSEDKIALLKGWSKLNDKQRSLIKDVTIKDGKADQIVWVECDETKALYACDCGCVSPELFHCCPICSAEFLDS